MKTVIFDQISSLNSKVRQVSTKQDSFDALKRAVEGLMETFEEGLSDVVRLATGGRSEASAQNAAAELFAQLREDALTELAILEFDYGSATGSRALPNADVTLRKKGGRPPAEFWDDMWATIAASLYDGALQPKSQADVERAMTDWIEAEGYSAAVSTVRARARRLWDRIDEVAE